MFPQNLPFSAPGDTERVGMSNRESKSLKTGLNIILLTKKIYAHTAITDHMWSPSTPGLHASPGLPVVLQATTQPSNNRQNPSPLPCSIAKGTHLRKNNPTSGKFHGSASCWRFIRETHFGAQCRLHHKEVAPGELINL